MRARRYGLWGVWCGAWAECGAVGVRCTDSTSGDVAPQTLLEQIKREYDRSYKGVAFEKISATVGLNVGKAETMGIRLLFWDLGGQAELQSMWEKYFAEAHAVVYVIDSTDGKRLHASQQTFGTDTSPVCIVFIHSFSDEMISHRLLESVPVLLLANKQDLDDAMSVESIKGVFNASASSVGVRDCKVQPVSAVVG